MFSISITTSDKRYSWDDANGGEYDSKVITVLYMENNSPLLDYLILRSLSRPNYKHQFEFASENGNGEEGTMSLLILRTLKYFESKNNSKTTTPPSSCNKLIFKPLKTNPPNILTGHLPLPLPKQNVDESLQEFHLLSMCGSYELSPKGSSSNFMPFYTNGNCVRVCSLGPMSSLLLDVMEEDIISSFFCFQATLNFDEGGLLLLSECNNFKRKCCLLGLVISCIVVLAFSFTQR